MSFSVSVPAGDVTGFADRAAKAKADYEAAIEGNDYALTQLASGLFDAGVELVVKAFDTLSKDGADQVGTVSLSGHAATDDKSASTLSLSVSVTPAAPAASAPAADEGKTP